MIVLIYVPLVFLGSNVFFPKYTGTHSYYQGPYMDCYSKHPYPAESKEVDAAQRQEIEERQRQCQDEQRLAQEQWEEDKRAYEGPKYVFIAWFNLVVLLVALFLPKLQDSVIMGLFLGSIGATFGATMIYFNTQSKIGFAILVVTFAAMLFFINRKKDTFVDWKGEKK